MTPGPTTLTLTVAAGFGVAFLHAAIPTHWLPFVVTAKVQHWTRQRTMFITGVAGLGHVLVTAIIGALLAWFGVEMMEKFGDWFPWLASGALFLFGLFYLIQQLRGKGHMHFLGGHGHHHHHDGHCEHDHAHDHDHGAHRSDESHERHELGETMSPPPHRSDWAAILSLFALLTFSPCEGFIPVYVQGAQFGWGGFLLLTATLSIATVIGMMVFTWFTLSGLAKLKLSFVERYENGVLGALLMLLAIAVVVVEKNGG